jgi:hypothetical protein
MFATDRDLLVLEPNLFRDVQWVGQRLVSGTGSISATTLTLASQDVGLDAAGVAAGHIVVVDGAPYEVLARLSASAATISRVRDDPDGAALTPSPVTGKPVQVVTFRPQIAIVHGQVMRMLGIEPGEPAEDGPPGEESITNPAALRTLEALGALHLTYAAAAGPGASGAWTSYEWGRAQMYRERFAEERQRAAARIDLDGDGLPDATRRLNVVQFVRG